MYIYSAGSSILFIYIYMSCGLICSLQLYVHVLRCRLPQESRWFTFRIFALCLYVILHICSLLLSIYMSCWLASHSDYRERDALNIEKGSTRIIEREILHICFLLLYICPAISPRTLIIERDALILERKSTRNIERKILQSLFVV